MTEASLNPDALSRYRIIRRLGTGGMGEVYLADDSRLGRQVALKVLPPEACSDPRLRLRFSQEARAAAMLSHPNICTVYDVGESSDGRIFITMEYVEGATLSEKSSGGLALDEILDLAIQAGEAIEEAHRKGVIHRDLKPGNLMLTPRGRLKVVDFGLAKVRASAMDSEETPTGLRTSPGVVLGTVAYMSPEQAFAEEVDQRSDIFSFGVVLYQLASGQRPFSGRSEVEIIDRIVHADPPPLDRARVPEDLERMLRKCLEKNREHRYQSMTDLLVDLRALQRSLRGGASSAANVVVPGNNLPGQITSFIGREREIEELRGLLREHRLVTVTGAAGCGKSRMAIEAGSRAVGGHSGGVWYVDLAGIADGSQVVANVAEVFGVKENEGVAVSEALLRNLCDRDLLLIIDNCEHVVEATATLVDDLLRAARPLRVLCTSREALNVSGECTWALPPLSVPSTNARISLDQAEAFDSIRLFVERSRAAQPRFLLSESNLGAVISICNAVDGIPLAIELAAARIKAMSPAEIASRLDNAFRLLAGQTRGARGRQHTLRAAVDWSYELLADEEKRLFERLSLFRSGFDLAAAETVGAFGVLAEADVIDLLSRVVEKSLVLAERRSEDTVRYRLLEPLRQYAREKLADAGDERETALRHCEYFTALAESAYVERIESSAAWLDRLELEHENFRAALDWAAAQRSDQELQIAGALGWFWYLHSHFTEGRARIRRALAGSTKRDRDTARALWALSMLGNWQSDRESRGLAERSLSIWRELGDDREVAMALEAIGWSAWFGDHDDAAARRWFEEALEIHEGVGDQRLINRTRLAICQVLVSEGNISRARPLAEEALKIAIAHGEERDIHSGYHFLADCALIEGDVLDAERLYRHSLRWALAYGDRAEAAFEMEGTAMALAGQGRHEDALRLAGAVAREREDLNCDASVPFWDRLVDRFIGAADRIAGEHAARLRAEGARMGFDAACDQALTGRAS